MGYIFSKSKVGGGETDLHQQSKPQETDMVSCASNIINLQNLLKSQNVFKQHVVDQSCFDVDQNELLSIFFNLFHGFHESLDNKLDESFTNIIDKPLTAKKLVELINKNESLAPYVVDSLKRYHSLHDVRKVLAECIDLKNQIADKNTAHKLEDIVDIITTRILLTMTIESMSNDSQRFLTNFIKKNDLPIPFTYYVWDRKNAAPNYKINFNCLMEVLCLTDDRLILQFGSEKSGGLGKTSLLPFIFNDKRKESLFIGTDKKYRASCIDVLFGNTKNNSCAIFDVHGTIDEKNSLLVQAIQAYAALQIVYVAEKDLPDPPNKSNDDFLNKVMNYSSYSSNVPTVVVIFDGNFEKEDKTQQLVNRFQNYYSEKEWPNMYWLSSPILSKMKDLSDLKQKRCLTKLKDQFSELIDDIETKVHAQLFRSCFSIQQLYLDLEQQNSNQRQTKIERRSFKFEIENSLEGLFEPFTDETENLKIMTPISYYQSEINTMKQKKLNNIMNDSSNIEFIDKDLKEIEGKQDSQHGFTKYSEFILDLFNNQTYINVLITEVYLEKWRLKYIPRIKEERNQIKLEKISHQKKLKELEKFIPKKNDLKEKVDVQTLEALKELREKDEQLNLRLKKVDKKLANADLTIGLLCDELFALYDYLYDKRPIVLDQYQDKFVKVAKNIAKLVNKGFGLHILRSRPLTCESRLMKMILDNLQIKENGSIVTLTVIGEQSSAKSSLLNTMFGCNFRTSAGRCTIGMYLGAVYYQNLTIIILDTEGLMSLEESGSIFDNQMVTMAVLTSHLVLINHKGELNSTLEGLMGMSLYAKAQIQSSPLKPKLFFILRDQTIRDTATDTFREQLNRFKDNLEKSASFLKVSVDDELDMKQENIILLPSAFSEDMNEYSNIRQRWRNQIFAYKINDLRAIAIRELQCCSEEFGLKTIDTLYNKLSSNWKTIDDLGLGLLECKSLAELQLSNELKSIAKEIIQKQSLSLLQEGGQLIKDLLSNEKKAIERIMGNEVNDIQLNSNVDMKIFIQNGFNRLDTLTYKFIEGGIKEYEQSTQQKCYASLKSNIQKNIESSIRCTQHLLKQQFEQDAYVICEKRATLQVQKRLLNIAKTYFDRQTQTATDIDELNIKLDAEYNELYQEFKNNLDLLKKSQRDITETVLGIYNGLVKTKVTTSDKYDISTFCSILDPTTYNEECSTLDNVFKLIQTYLAERKQRKLVEKIKSLFTDSQWEQLNRSLCWFIHPENKENNRKILSSIIENVIPQLNQDIMTMLSTVKLSYNDPKLVVDLMQYIDNAVRAQTSPIQQHLGQLNKPKIIKDLLLIALRILIEQASQIAGRQNNDLENKLDELKGWKENIQQQFLMIKDSSEQGQNFKDDLKKQIVQELIRIYTNVVVTNIREKITNNSAIDPDKIATNAYDASIGSNPPNANNIMKYIIDINHYYLEIALSKIKISRETITEDQILLLQQNARECVSTALDTVKNHPCKNIRQVYQDIVKNIRKLVPDFELSPLIGISAEIKNPEQFKTSFEKLLLDRNNIYKNIRQSENQLKAVAVETAINLIKTRLGCQARCPGCGSKCDNTDVDHKKHNSKRHLTLAFFGWPIYDTNEPCLSLCYQNWLTCGVHCGEEVFRPTRNYYKKRQPDWLDDLDSKSKTGDYRNDSKPPPEQRRAWMAVRKALIQHYSSRGMIDVKQYDHALYPNIESISADYALKWDEDI